MLVIEIKGGKEFRNNLGRFVAKKPAQKLSKEMADDLVMNLKSICPVWNWNLFKSIKAVPQSDGYEISMNFYWRFLEYGHKITKVVPYLRYWALAKLSNPDRFFRMIHWSQEKGIPYRTKAQPFVESSLNKTLNNFPNISKTVIRTKLKESGFHK